MSVLQPAARTPAVEARILVVDDDRRVLELLEIAFSTQGFKVLTASDGDEAIRCATQESPDLIILDVRLPRRSGLDVCEMLRRDLPEPGIPILMVSAAVETETRLQAFARGADDFIAKPFSPKELVARVRRLLSRTHEARDARQRIHDLERELGRAQGAVQRAHDEARREHRLHQLVIGPGHQLHRSLDIDEIVAQLLHDAQSRLGSGFVALLWSDRAGAPLRPWAVRGESLERIGALAIERGSALGTLVEGLGRPLLRRELDRFPELRSELPPFLAHGITVLAPISGTGGLDGLLVADERRDGSEPPAIEMEMLAHLCELASDAMRNASRVREQLLVVLAQLAEATAPDAPAESREARAAAFDEAARLVEQAASATLVAPRQRTLLEVELRLAPSTPGSGWRAALDAMCEHDATGLVRDLLALEDHAALLDPVGDDWLPEESRAPLLLQIGRAFGGLRAEGLTGAEALERAVAGVGEALDPATAQALRGALREVGEGSRAD